MRKTLLKACQLGFEVLLYIGQILYILDAVRLSRILIGKQKQGRTFNSDKLGGIAFTKISKLTMCSA